MEDGRLRQEIKGSGLSFALLRFQYANTIEGETLLYEVMYAQSDCHINGEDPYAFPICNYEETIRPTSMNGAQNFSRHFGDDPYDNLLLHSSPYGYSFFEDGQSWTMFPKPNRAEAEWDMGMIVEEPEFVEVNAYVARVKVDAHVPELYLGLALDGKLMKLNDGSFYQRPTAAGTHSLVPQTLPRGKDLPHIQLAIMVVRGEGSGEPTPGPGAESISIDAAWVQVGYRKPCDIDCYLPEPQCSPADYVAQSESLIQIRERMQQLADSEYSGLSFPLNLNRVVLCGGEVLYLLDEELAMLAGEYLTDQVVVIGSAAQTFTLRSQGEATGGGGNDGEPGLSVPDLFAMELHYDEESQPLDAPAQYNGNIAWTKWQVRGHQASYYGYRYDELDRLKKATYAEDLGGAGMSVTNKYTVDSPEGYIQYDKRGNIELLRRNGGIGSCKAGGRVSDFSGGANYLFGQEMLAAAPGLYAEGLRVIGEGFGR